MIRYTLKCASDHSFESWFQSADAYDTLIARNMVACPVCGGTKVTKALMAPRVRVSKKKAGPAPTAPAPSTAEPTMPPEAMREHALAELRKHVENNSEYVGMNFVKEARAIHDGVSPERAIYGEAKLEDAKSLIEDGVPVAPLPFTPKQKMN